MLHMKQHLNISITPGSVLVTALILIGFTALYLLRDIALLVLTAIVIASSLEPGIAFFMGTVSRASPQLW